MIEVRSLSKSFPGRKGVGDVQALHDVSFTINDNEFVTILGPSGCGKTTLLRNIGGLVPWDAGEVLIDGVAVTGPGPDRAMVFQGYSLLPWASALTNVAYGLELRGVPKKEREDKARSLLDLVGLRGFERRYPHELSGGMQQRVGLARALAVEPRTLLMDEPFGGLDEQTRRLLQEQLLRIWEHKRITVVFVTHSMEEAVLLGDRVILMDARPGRIVDIVSVPLARPRSRNVDSVEASRDFVEITRNLWMRLRTMQVGVAMEGLS